MARGGRPVAVRGAGRCRWIGAPRSGCQLPAGKRIPASCRPGRRRPGMPRCMLLIDKMMRWSSPGLAGQPALPPILTELYYLHRSIPRAARSRGALDHNSDPAGSGGPQLHCKQSGGAAGEGEREPPHRTAPPHHQGTSTHPPQIAEAKRRARPWPPARCSTSFSWCQS